jgi:hypothetical protein
VGTHYIRTLLKTIAAVMAVVGAFYPHFAFAGQPSSSYPYGAQYVQPGKLRFAITPKQAVVYVDGYYAGTVEDFDGTFQRLRVEPGPHEVVIHLQGYRSRRERVYLGPDQTVKLSGALEKLSAGEPDAPLPTPSAPPDGGQPRDPRSPDAGPPRGSSGTLAVRVRPDGAEVLIDGEPAAGFTDDGRLVFELAPGPHQIEIRLNGYRTFLTEVPIRPGTTTPLNITLTRNN